MTILLVAAGAALPYVVPGLERFRPIRPDRAATLLASPFSGRPTVPLTVEVVREAESPEIEPGEKKPGGLSRRRRSAGAPAGRGNRSAPSASECGVG